MSERFSGSESSAATVSNPAGALNSITYLALVVIAAVICGQMWLVFNLNINWDEFFHLSVIHEHLRGTMDRTLQTFHVYLFGWLGRLQISEVAQIAIGRAIMLACECGTALLIYAISRRFAPPWAAVMGALAFLTAKYTMTHGMSFRADPLTAFLLMSCLYLLISLRPKVWQICLAGVCGALAVMVTIKSALYLPAFAAVIMWRWQTDRDRLKTAGGIAAVAVVGSGFLIGLYLWHAAQVNPEAVARTSAMAGSAAKKTFLEQDLFPRNQEVMRWALGSVMALALVAFGFVQAARGQKFILALFAAPLLSVFVYRNAFPYFLPFIIPPVMVVAAVGATAFADKRKVLLAMIGLMTFGAASEFISDLTRDQIAQRQTLEAVHKMFEEPVTYIDRSAMVPGFPRTGFFMTTWAMGSYREKGQPVFADYLKNDQPRFLIANSPIIEGALTNKPLADERWRMMEEDAAVLRDNFVHHWGAIWVAGKTLSVGVQPARFDLLIEGPHTLESKVNVMLDGQLVAPGETVDITAGTHVIVAETPEDVTLRWGRTLHMPDGPAPEGPIFAGL